MRKETTYDGDDDVDPAVVQDPVGHRVLWWCHPRVVPHGLR